MPFTPSQYITINKPLGPGQGFSLDGRSYMKDTQGRYRPFASIAEVKATLNTQIKRQGHYDIIVNEGGTLNSDGTFTGGTPVVYWWKFPTDPDPSVKFSSTPSGIIGSIATSTVNTVTIANLTEIPNNSVGLVDVSTTALGIGDKLLIGRKVAKYHKNTAGVLTIVGVVEDFVADSLENLTTATWNIVVNPTTNNLDVEVIGEAGVDLIWTSVIRKPSDLDITVPIQAPGGVLAQIDEINGLQSTLNSKVDLSAINEITNALASKADSSALTTLQSNLNNKADQSSVSSLQNTINAKLDSSRKVNNKALTSDITLTPADIGITADLTTTNAFTGNGNNVPLGINTDVVLAGMGTKVAQTGTDNTFTQVNTFSNTVKFPALAGGSDQTLGIGTDGSVKVVAGGGGGGGSYVDLTSNQTINGFKTFGSPLQAPRAVLTVGNAGDTPLVLKTAPSASAPFLDCRNSDGNPIGFIHEDGRIEFPKLTLFGMPANPAVNLLGQDSSGNTVATPLGGSGTPSNMVTTDTDQNISGRKIFTTVYPLTVRNQAPSLLLSETDVDVSFPFAAQLLLNDGDVQLFGLNETTLASQPASVQMSIRAPANSLRIDRFGNCYLGVTGGGRVTALGATVAFTGDVQSVPLTPITKAARNALTGIANGTLVYVSDNGGYLSVRNNNAWEKVTTTAD